MLSFIDTILLAVSAIALVPALTLALQAAGSLSVMREQQPAKSHRHPAAIVIPAHDEGVLLAPTVHSVSRQLVAGDRVVVVADNCSDDTAEVARALGAEVVVRHDRTRTGKAYALQAGLQFLEQTGVRDTVVFVDADCILEPGALDVLVRASAASDGPVQARYVMQIQRHADIRQRIGAFAWRVKNELRPAGYRAFNLPCQLMGTGMALPNALLRRIDIASGHIAEDVVLGLQCTLLQRPPSYCPQALVASSFAPSESGRDAQKTRWIHGQFDTIREFFPRLLSAFFARRDVGLLAAMLDIAVPPLAILGASLVSLLAIAVLWWIATGSIAPAMLAGLATLLASASLAIAWWRHGRDLVGLGELVSLPIYASRQLAIAWRYLGGRRSGWIRSER